ncbi:MAG: hypothetical protein IT233_09035 [Bacteroidia bacterium]|nr:hypothetical protein [Bacteroidia bacterium]
MKEKGKIIQLRKSEGINPKKEPLTVSKLKELMGNKEMSDDEAQEIIFAIEALANIIVQFQLEQELLEKENSEHNIKQAA